MSIDPRWKTLNTAILSDVLDGIACREQVVSPGLVPLNEEDLVVGRARTGLWSRGESPEGNAYLNLVALIDTLAEGDFVVFAQDEIPVCSLWGDILSTVANSKGTVGAIVDGLIRDPVGSREVGFSVWSRGNTPVDPAGRAYLSATDIAVSCGGVTVEPEALLLADADGVVVVPPDLEEEVLNLGLKKLADEEAALSRLQKGDSLTDVFGDLGAV